MTTQQPPKPKAGLATLVIHHSITVLILVLFLALGTWAYLTFSDSDFFATVDRAEFEARISPPIVEAQRQRIQVGLEVFHHLHDRYPGRLEELVEAGLLLDSDLFYPRSGELWDYQRRSEGFELTRTRFEDQANQDQDETND